MMLSNKIFDISTLKELDICVNYLANALPTGVIYLEGDLGVGKTTFVAHWLALLGVKDLITSPTYNLVNEYQLPSHKTVLHADLYRLSSADELLYLDVDEWEKRAKLIFIEWARRGEGFLPPASAIATLTLGDKNRYLTWQITSDYRETVY